MINQSTTRTPIMIGTQLGGMERNRTKSCAELTVLPSVTESLIDALGRGVIFVNSDGILTLMNQYAEEILMVRRESVIGLRLDMLPLRTQLYKVLSEPCNESPLEMSFGGRTVQVQSREVVSPSGSPMGQMTEVWDITEQKQEILKREEFVSMMTHDLKSPLAVIIGYLQGVKLGMCGQITAKLRVALDKTEESALKLHSMIEEMLDAYRLEVGLLQPNRQPCDIGALLEECCRDNQGDAKAKGIKLQLTRQKGDLPLLNVDRRQLVRVFNNLISNAVKFTPQGGKVRVRVELQADIVRVSVSDTGIGIPAQDLPRIFYKYFRSSSATTIKGTGLGLAISRSIVEINGGTIGVESTVGKGSTFLVSLPLGDSPDPGAGQP
jgi:signal transduction histidine kinase